MSAGIPLAFSDNRPGRKECAECRPGPYKTGHSHMVDLRGIMEGVSREDKEEHLSE